MDITLDFGFLHFLFVVIAVSPLAYLVYYKWTERAYQRHVDPTANGNYTE